MPVCVVDCKRSSPALWSRCAYPVLTETLHGPALEGFLRDQGSRLGERPFMVVTDELACRD
jgi:D-aspartate ligase